MNQFGHMADDLTTMEMMVERMQGSPHAKALKAALQRAFIEACKASRAQRLLEENAGTSNRQAPPKFGLEAATGQDAASKPQPRIRKLEFSRIGSAEVCA